MSESVRLQGLTSDIRQGAILVRMLYVRNPVYFSSVRGWGKKENLKLLMDKTNSTEVTGAEPWPRPSGLLSGIWYSGCTRK